MLHVENQGVRDLLLDGNIGLEKESLRVDAGGHMSHTRHPFDTSEEHITRDFCENQTEINTPVCHSAKEAYESLNCYYQMIQKKLNTLPCPELLWPFSNPPYIKNEEDIPVAQFQGLKASKTAYREYLSDRYGRYKMTFSGIHFNYSFSEELLRTDYALRSSKDPDSMNFTEYKNQLYLELAEHAAAYGWLMTAVTAASPLQDRSFVEKGVYDQDVFLGMASVRCSELGYWNPFTPVFDYTGIDAYVNSIQSYVDEGLLRAPTELYFPIRLKPRGENRLQSLLDNGVDHIELRMFDLNPLDPVGVDERDIFFAQLFLIWLASLPKGVYQKKDQVQAVQNFKNAARFDLKTVKIVAPGGAALSVADAALAVLGRMERFYREFPEAVQQVLRFEKEKFTDRENRYAWKILRDFSGTYVKKGLELARRRQEESYV